MNGTGDGSPPTNKNTILIVVIAIAVDATIGIGALGWCLVSNTKPDATLLTAFVGLSASLFGYLGGMLSQTRPSSQAPSPPIVPPVDTGKIIVPEQPLKTEQPQPWHQP